MFQLRNHPAYPYAVRVLLVGAIIVLAFLVVRSWPTIRYGSPGTSDFIEYWSAGQLLRHGENPYDFERLLAVEKEQGWPEPFPLMMWNPPWVLIWLFPLLLTSFGTATLLWLSTSLAIILVASSLLWMILNPYQTRHQLPIVWLASVVFAPTLLTLRLGQINSLVLLGVVGFLFFSQRERDLFAGVSLALTTVKPHIVYLMWVVIVWWVITQRRWKILAGWLGMLAVSSTAVTAMRPAWITDYLTALDNPPLRWLTPTIGGVLRGLVGIRMNSVQFLAPTITGLLIAGYLLRARPAIRWVQAIGPILLLSVATAAYRWTHDELVLLVPYLQLVAWFRKTEAYSTTDKVAIIGGLILYWGALIAQNLLMVEELNKFWVLWVLAGTYAYSWLRRRSTPTGPLGLGAVRGV